MGKADSRFRLNYKLTYVTARLKPDFVGEEIDISLGAEFADLQSYDKL